ncbi:glycosyltransferase family 2 protein [Fibrivirga algicola]|uniref:Glycosyltransferase family 2 protein n=1 Tax=Fibrivirga algicola TaxID=2950420 RepID=A0ABX0QG76_9BACT|nr:glycosyltransferase family 2 protein [Fibrivirga algicola]ARK10162.1 glycosyl transferase family 2 [Fibrella sp. ES10-3-2-2]NID11390.1 glycosyltransferase family 2 protein [Fibrivirga algicola]
MNSAFPLISLVTINYNQAEMTRLFLESARKLTYPAFEIIVVDNASIPALSTQVDLAQYPFVRLVRSEQNLGFTGGNNLGIEAAKGDYFFIVNNDTELEANLLTELIKPFLQDPRVGVVCPKIRFFDTPNLVQFAGYGPMNMFTGTAHLVGFNQPDGPQFDQPGTSPFAHGCAMLVSRTVVNRVGRFADRFFLYYEELDWSQRIRTAGFSIQYQPTATIWHKESASVGRESTIRTYYMTRNRILFIRRHGSLAERVFFYGFFAVAVLPKHVASYVLKGRFEHAGAFLKATLWNLQNGSASAV